MALFDSPQQYSRLVFSPVVLAKRVYLAQRKFALEDVLASKHVDVNLMPQGAYSSLYTLQNTIENLIHLRGLIGMAKAKATPSKVWNGFVNCELSAEDKTYFRVWDVEVDDAFDLLLGRVVGNYRLSISYNKKNDNFIASLTANEGTGANEGYTLSAFGKDMPTAIRVLAFKDSHILSGNWSAAVVAAKDDIG